MPILKHKLFSFFPEALKKYRDEPKRQDAYIRAKRVHDLLAQLMEVSNDQCVPSKSLLREFIGGSDYKY
jgi:uridine kinase